MKARLIAYAEAIRLTLENITPLGSESVSVAQCVDRVSAADLHALVDSPSVDASMKDGYAIRSSEIRHATPENPVRLKLVATSAAGSPCDHTVEKGTAIRILTGAKIPQGADAVVAEEFATRDDQWIIVTNHASTGRNIMAKGCDVALNDLVCARGDRLTPGAIAILSASGHSEIPVFRSPEVAILATGDEIIMPGRPLPKGKLYASNLAMLNAWCRHCGMSTSMDAVGDKPEAISQKLENVVETHDAILTSGGAWTGDRDHMATMMEALGWKRIFHRVRMGPGKAVGFGLWKQKPVFVLPGGPSSNLLAFLQIALPGLLKLSGYRLPELATIPVSLAQTVAVRDVDWTQFIFGVFNRNKDGLICFEPLELKSRLQSMAMAQGVIAVPEGVKEISAGSIVSAQLLARLRIQA